MATDNDILRDAIIGTEKEIFSEGFDKEDLTHDETGDRSQEAMGDGLEGQVEPEDDDGEGEGEGEAVVVQTEGAVETAPEGQTTPTPTEPQPDMQGRVPAGRLREEAERARAAIAERDQIRASFEAAQRAIAEREAVIQQLAQAAQSLTNKQTQTPTPEAPKAPDLFEDPVAYAEHIKRGVIAELEAHNRQIRDREVNASLEAAHQRHGKVYEEAFSALKGMDFRNPDNVTLVRRMEASPNPGETVVAWHRRNQALREVGTDIDGYRTRIAEETRKNLMADPEFRKELLASLRGEAMTGDEGRPRTTTKLPQSLSQKAGNGARATDIEIFDSSPRAMFDSAWST